MIVEDPHGKPLEAPEVEEPDAGVIEEARRRRRRERMFLAAAAALSAGAVAPFVVLGQGTARRVPAAHKSMAPRPLTGPPLNASTHLRLVVSENTGPASIVDVDSGRVQAVRGLGVPRRYRLWGPMLYPLTPVPGGTLAVVTRQACGHCIATKTNFLIGAGGSVRRTSSLALPRDQQSTHALGSAVASWVLTSPRTGRCTVRLEPGSSPAVAAPCGTLGLDTPAGLVITRGREVSLVDPRTGRVRERLAVRGQFDVLSHNLALIGTATGMDNPLPLRNSLTLVNLSTGARSHLRWPSALDSQSGYSVIREAHGPLVALDFGDPAYHMSSRQVSDVWILDPRTDKFMHVPGFPIFEALKFSGLAWTADGRLVVAAEGLRYTAIGLWHPGSTQLQVGRLPRLAGYTQLVPLGR